MKEVLTISVLTDLKRTNELKKALTSALKEIYDKVYYRKAPATVDYPYITYYLKHNKQGHQYDYFWEVHTWTRDIKLAEELADIVEEFDKSTYKDQYQAFDVDLNSRNNVEDEDKEIQHIVLLFNLTYFTVKG